MTKMKQNDHRTDLIELERLTKHKKKTESPQGNSILILAKQTEEPNWLIVILYLIPDSVSQYLIFQ